MSKTTGASIELKEPPVNVLRRHDSLICESENVARFRAWQSTLPALVDALGERFFREVECASRFYTIDNYDATSDAIDKVSDQWTEFGMCLSFACREGYIEDLRSLLEHRSTSKATAFDLRECLLTVCHEGDLETLRLLLGHGATPSARELCTASARGNLQVVERLHNYGIPVDGRAELGSNDSYSRPYTALEEACRFGRQSVVEFLLGRGASVEISRRAYCPSALQLAAANGFFEISKMLIEHGADVNQFVMVENFVGMEDFINGEYPPGYCHWVYTPLELCLRDGLSTHPGRSRREEERSNSESEDMACLLLENGAECRWRDIQRPDPPKSRWPWVESGFEGPVNLLQTSVEYGFERFVTLLLNKLVLFGQLVPFTQEALYRASVMGHEGIVTQLLAKGADANASVGEDHPHTALHAASSQAFNWIAQMLIDLGADVESRKGDYGTPLQAAAAGGHEDVVRTLLDSGADVHARNRLYDTPVEEATYGGYESIVELLISRGAKERVDRTEGGEPGTM